MNNEIEENVDFWQIYQNADEVEAPVYAHSNFREVQEANYVGIPLREDTKKWDQRPDHHKYLIFPTHLKINYNWKAYHVVHDFLDENECETLINDIEETISIAEYNNTDFQQWNEDGVYEQYRASGKTKIGSKNKIYNPFLDKYEFIPRRIHDCNHDEGLKLDDNTFNWRDSFTNFVNPYKFGQEWLWEKISTEIERLNNKYWKVDLTSPVTQEPMQYTKYIAPMGNYDWHTDTHFGGYAGLRKLSYVIQLSDPREYEGGYLQIVDQSRPEQEMPKNRGSLIVFPSMYLHRLTRVTKGVRYAAVGWVTGNHWR